MAESDDTKTAGATRPNEGRPGREQLLEGLAALMRQRDGEVEAGRHTAERERLVRAMTAPEPRRVSWTWAAAPLAAAAVVLLLAWPDAAIDYSVQGAQLAEQGYLRAEHTEAKVVFSEGSEVVLDRGSVGRIVAVDDAGARLLLEQGRISLRIEHLDGARWSVAAGPYSVAVTGTEFDVRWDPRDQQLDVALHQGAVVVRGPMVRDGVTMQPGQHLVARVPQRELEIGDANAKTAATEPEDRAKPEASSTSETSPRGEPGDGEPIAGAKAMPRVGWNQRIADGEFEIVLAEAEARGVEQVLGSAPLGDVMALADAARYKGRSGLARRALESVRRRFAGSEASRTAAFLLGRMSEGSPTSAITWYDRYMAEAPGGTFAAEALGRKMALLDKSGRGAEARAVAARYLRLYPKGAYAPLAGELVQ